jgi:hypothetical protein
MRLQYNFGGLFTIFYLNLHPDNVQLETILLRIFWVKSGEKVILRPSCQITYPEIGSGDYSGLEMKLFCIR